jgi:hypothetical protein
MIRTNSFLLAAFLAAVAWPAAAQETLITTSTTINTATSVLRVIVGASTAPGPTLTIASPANITMSDTTVSSFIVGRTHPSSSPGRQEYAAVVQTGGTVTTAGGFIMSLGEPLNSPYAGSASYTMSGGSLVMTGTADDGNRFFMVGRSGTATFTQSGGLVSNASPYSLYVGGGPGSSGVYSITSGTYEGTNTGTSTAGDGLGLSVVGGSGRLTINGSDAVVAVVTPSPNLDPGLVRESSCPDWGWKGFSDEEATQCRADRGLASAG